MRRQAVFSIATRHYTRSPGEPHDGIILLALVAGVPEVDQQRVKFQWPTT